jgi:hypothetical protein
MRLFLILNLAALMRLAFCNAHAHIHAVDEKLAAEKQPRIFCEESTFDFGSRDASETVDHTFVLKNTGTSDLEIKRVQPACGCTTAELERKIVPPGKESKIFAKLSLAGRNGPVQKPILIESNDPVNPNFQLVMKGIIGGDFQITPSLMVLRKNTVDSLATASAIVKMQKNEPFEILTAKSDSEKLKVHWKKLPNENSYQVTADFEGNLQPGEDVDKIVLETSHLRSKSLEIPVIVVAPKPIIAIPQKITINANRSDSVSRAIMLKSTTGEKLSISKVETPNPSITVSVDLTGDYGARILLRNIQPKLVKIGNSIKIHLGTGEVIQIPFEIKDKN